LGFFYINFFRLGYYFKRDFICGEWAGRKKERYCEKVFVRTFFFDAFGLAKRRRRLTCLFVWWGFAKGSRGAIWSQVDTGIHPGKQFLFFWGFAAGLD
jgi:hypothetical protein